MADVQQVNVPGLVIILVLSGILLKYFFSTPSPAGSGDRRRGAARDPAALARSREAAVQRIQQMFPHLDRRSILWDLQRTAGNIQATTDRILAGRLETPPATFQPPPPPEGSTPASSTGNTAAKPATPAQPDLITRYNLANKLNAPVEDDGAKASPSGKVSAKAWSSNRDERQTLLQKRRDQMILEARRKMEAKLAAEKAAKGTA
ncbi:hypothetical protein B0T21DRAFT_368450 [Apiosordaria backusii]|uniref:Coupling of ubiquitin conjugation to ER degradation protein 1 n=1 Tax=Apiosordaria backusii TaxID=314023 RepID=A0AA40EDA7_9PEZI|nr:hypothetical protein B0T21DRAFT_368450 [Apiosordaria backusii]